MDNFVEDPIRNPENPEKPEYSVKFTNVYKEPHDVFKNTYLVLKNYFHYPIQLKERAANIYENEIPNGLEVMVDKNETKTKIDTVLDKLWQTDIFCLLRDAGKGNVWDVMNLLQGDFHGYFKLHPTVKVDKIDKPNFSPVIEESFITSYEVREKEWEKEKPSSVPSKIPEFKKIYDGLKEKGVQPLTPESIGGLLAPVIQKILDEHPELRPNPSAKSDFDEAAS